MENYDSDINLTRKANRKIIKKRKGTIRKCNKKIRGKGKRKYCNTSARNRKKLKRWNGRIQRRRNISKRKFKRFNRPFRSRDYQHNERDYINDFEGSTDDEDELI